MSSPKFLVENHTIAASHIREYPDGARSPAAALKLKLAIKRYTPCNQTAAPNALTIIATHANGVPKETYEPLWDELLDILPSGTIRSIWFADCTHQGASAILNDSLLGDDPNYFDHSRDLFVLVNRFAAQMPQPIVGIGHSMGCAQLLRLSSLHPRLICGLALIEPILQSSSPPGPNPAMASSYRKDWWPSRAVAEEALRSNYFFKSWTDDAFKRFVEFGLRETPTELYPEDKVGTGSVTLTTSKAQEAWSFLRGNFKPVSDEESERRVAPNSSSDTRLHLFTRPEILQMNEELVHVRPDVLFVFGEKSFINMPQLREDKMRRTGTGLNGNGGAVAGNVVQAVIKGGFHMLPMERTKEVAAKLGPWLSKQREAWVVEQQWHRDYDRGTSENEMSKLSKQWLQLVRHKASTPRSLIVKL